MLERALPIDGPEGFEPSGLVQYDGRLLTISDRDDRTLYELDLGETSAVARPFRTLSFPEEETALDFEGLALGGDGDVLLVSESTFRVLSVRPDGTTRWITPSLESAGQGAGLFQKDNADFEGLVRLPDGRLLLAAEREPRGLVELSFGGGAAEARAWQLPASKHPAPKGRCDDFADLTLAGDQVFALYRNAHLVQRLERGATDWQEREAWSYAATENDPRFAFDDATFGLAEGLVVDRFFVFVVLDANGTHRKSDAGDTRPLLFVFKRPA